MASLSSQVKLVVAESSGHHVHLEEPNLLVQTVTEFVERLRDGARPTRQEERREP